MLKERWALRICKLNFVACLTELVTITVTSLRGETGRKGSLVAVLYADWMLGWYLLGGMLQPKLTSRGVIWFLVECQVISRMLLDESRGEHNSPCVNSTTTSMTSAQKVMGGWGGGAVSWQAKWYCTMVPCLLMRRVQIELKRTVIVSRKPLNSVQARNQILPQVHIALQITCCLYQLILFRSAAFSPFSSTAEVIQRHQLQLRQSKRGRRCRVRNGWPEIRGKVL